MTYVQALLVPLRARERSSRELSVVNEIVRYLLLSERRDGLTPIFSRFSHMSLLLRFWLAVHVFAGAPKTNRKLFTSSFSGRAFIGFRSGGIEEASYWQNRSASECHKIVSSIGIGWAVALQIHIDNFMDLLRVIGIIRKSLGNPKNSQEVKQSDRPTSSRRYISYCGQGEVCDNFKRTTLN